MSHRRFVLPRRDASWLIEPAFDLWPQLLAANVGWAEALRVPPISSNEAVAQTFLSARTDRNVCATDPPFSSSRISTKSYDCQGRDLIHLRDTTREHVRIAATEYTSQLLGEPLDPLSGRQAWVVTGHQPELFHVGVWAKNFAAHRLAHDTNSIGLNLIVDQDRHAGMAISVPIGTRLEPGTVKVPFDQPRPAGPWEELPIANRHLFDSFATRVRQALEPWQIEPVLTEAWPAAKAHADRIGPRARLADCLAAVRVTMEHRWGAGNLELPMSRVSELPAFHWFAAHLLAHLPSFQQMHNAAVHEYRRRHKLRSRTHPVPDLATDDGWLEAPFWVLRAGEAQRHRLFARQRNNEEIELRDRDGVFLTLPLSPDRTACCAVDRLATLPRQGIRLRSRALTTTLFARLFLADLFVHGIGGAKYDEITDELIVHFFGLPTPEFATISATLHLPLGGAWPVDGDDVAKISQHLWRLAHQPERFIAQPSAAAQHLIEEKRQLTADECAKESAAITDRSFAAREANRTRYRRLHEINRLLQPDVDPIRAQLQSRRRDVLSLRNANRVLGSREFSWVLFPSESLRRFLVLMPAGMTCQE